MKKNHDGVDKVQSRASCNPVSIAALPAGRVERPRSARAPRAVHRAGHAGPDRASKRSAAGPLHVKHR